MPGPQEPLPNEIDWSRIETFIGYGSLEAPIVFIGTEEGLAASDDLRQDLLARSTFAPVMDVKAAHEGLADGPALFSEHPRRQPTWRVMADVMLHFEKKIASDPKERSRGRTKYRSQSLGRAGGDSLLIELFPYPNQNESVWPYTDRFADRNEYVDKILPPRLTLLSQALEAHPRSAIICYGHDAWPNFKGLFGADTTWQSVERDHRKYECALWRNAKVTLAYHFSRWFNTDHELDELSSVALPG